jgi:hypothetical protein
MCERRKFSQRLETFRADEGPALLDVQDAALYCQGTIEIVATSTPMVTAIGRPYENWWSFGFAHAILPRCSGAPVSRQIPTVQLGCRALEFKRLGQMLVDCLALAHVSSRKDLKHFYVWCPRIEPGHGHLMCKRRRCKSLLVLFFRKEHSYLPAFTWVPFTRKFYHTGDVESDARGLRQPTDAHMGS